MILDTRKERMWRNENKKLKQDTKTKYEMKTGNKRTHKKKSYTKSMKWKQHKKQTRNENKIK